MSSDEDDRYIKTLIATVQELAQQLGTIREQVKEDTTQLLASYRQDVHRTLIGIHARILSYEDELVKDRTFRERRQGEIDAQLGAIRNSQRWRVRIEIAIVVGGLVALAYLIGRGM